SPGAPPRRRPLPPWPAPSSHSSLALSPDQLADAIRREFGAQEVEPGALRRALNTFRWVDPTTLPASAPASRLSREVHSFSRVFTGCFYDVIRNVFHAGPRTPAGLQSAALAAGRLLLAALRTAPLTPRLPAPAARRPLPAVAQRWLRPAGAPAPRAHVEALRTPSPPPGLPLAAPPTTLAPPLPRSAAAARRALCDELGAPRGTRLAVTRVD